jgi:hypothetical protein
VLAANTKAQPLRSWINVQTECGAIGDGKADDTAAIQKGLDLIRPEDSKRKILYFPAGVYRITRALEAMREKHREFQGVGLQGEGPERSVIVYNGKGDEPMLRWGAWYSTIRGLGFQPQGVESGRREVERGGKPTAGISFGPKFATMNEVADCNFTGLPVGILGGERTMAGQAETCVRRCRFDRCETGILLQNWNSLDWWVWDSRFTECGTALSNEPGCGNFNAYRCVFESSRRADVRVGHVLGAFSLVENRSRGSRRFFETRAGHTAGGIFTLQGNRVEWDGRESAVEMGNGGPVLALDNQFMPTGGGRAPAIRFFSANRIDPTGVALLMGNQTSGSRLQEAEKGYEVREIEDGSQVGGDRPRVTDEDKAESETREVERAAEPTVAEIKAGASGDQIQAVMDRVADGSVIHLPAGEYRLREPLRIRGVRRITVLGDGLLNATVLRPQGEYGKRGLVEVERGVELEMRDLWLDAPAKPGGPVGMIVRTEDQPGIRLRGDQVMTTGWGPGLVVEGMDEGRVILENHWHSGVTVIGGSEGGSGGKKKSGRVEILQGMSTRDRGQNPVTATYETKNGGRIYARDLWFEGDNRSMLAMDGGGELILVGGHVAPNKAAGHRPVDSFFLEGDQGEVFLGQLALNGAQIGVGRFGPGYRATLFGLGFYPGTGVFDRLATSREAIYPKNFVQLFCRNNHREKTGAEPVRDIHATGDLADRFGSLRQWRLTEESEVAPIRLHRVGIWGSLGLVIVMGEATESGKKEGEAAGKP